MIFRLIGAFILCLGVIQLITIQASAFVVDSADYNFPIQSNYISSLTTVALPYCDLEYSKIDSHIQTPLLDEREFTFFHSPREGAKKALIIYSGLGGHQKTAISKWLACFANKNGYDVYVAPNSFTSSYLKAASFDGLPGEPSRDSKELYDFTKALLKSPTFVTKDYLSVVSIGYSHGALLNAHIAALALRDRVSLFDSILLINPPLDLYFGMKTLDHFAADYSVGVPSAVKFLRRTTKWRHQHLTSEDMNDFYSGFEKYFEVDDDKSAALIGQAFSLNMSSVVKSALKQYDHPDVPKLLPRKSKAYGASKRRRDRYIASLGFIDYLEMFVQKYLYADEIRSVESINSSNSLYPIAEEIFRTNRVRLITNADDFLLQKDKDLQWIQQTFGERSLLYPYGGHLGNIAYPENASEMTHWLSTGHFKHENTAILGL